MVSNQLVKTFLVKKICLNLIKTAKITQKTRTIHVLYTKPFLKEDGKIKSVIYITNMEYENEADLQQDTNFLKKWNIKFEK